MSRNFNWHYQNTVVDNTDDELLNPDIYQFCHLIWSIHDGGILSDYYNCIKPLLNKLNAVSVLKIKANLLTKREIIKNHLSIIEILFTQQQKLLSII